MNNYCRHCGQKMKKGATVCPSCKTEVIDKRVDPEKKKREIEKTSKEENKYFMISLILLLAPTACTIIESYLSRIGIHGISSLLEPILPLCYTAGLAMLIYTIVKFPKSKKAKGLLATVIAMWVVYLILSILLIYACVKICTGV